MCWFCDELMPYLAIKLHLVRNFYWRAQLFSQISMASIHFITQNIRTLCSCLACDRIY